jgi:hypothetical protein
MGFRKHSPFLKRRIIKATFPPTPFQKKKKKILKGKVTLEPENPGAPSVQKHQLVTKRKKYINKRKLSCGPWVRQKKKKKK